jgi:3-phenylpropionate/trans-cinnamate dioxygenase ferredoxin reductase subunit
VTAKTIAIVGAGHAGCQLATSLRELDSADRIVLISNESGPPYQRPPLSKEYLLGRLHEDSLPLRAEGFFANQQIELVHEHVSHIHPDTQQVQFESGEMLHYDELVLATGARNRILTVPGVDQRNVYSLRTAADALALREVLKDAKKVAVIGAGFIGMEFAAVARELGAVVTVVEVGTMPMARATSPEISAFMQRQHEERGTRFKLGSQVVAFDGANGSASHVRLATGELIETDLVFIGVGAIANSQLADDANLEISPTTRGIVVDDRLCTSDARISAIGDCADQPGPLSGERVRYESLQNAQDQARFLALRLSGGEGRYKTVPWFWSDQGAIKLQIAGSPARGDQRLQLGDPSSGRFSVLSVADGCLVAVESINDRANHLAARTVLSSAERVEMTGLGEPVSLVATAKRIREAHRLSAEVG